MIAIVTEEQQAAVLVSDPQFSATAAGEIVRAIPNLATTLCFKANHPSHIAFFFSEFLLSLRNVVTAIDFCFYSCPRLFALFILYIIFQEKYAAICDCQRYIRDAYAIVLPQQFAIANVVRENFFAEHNLIRHGAGLVVGQPAWKWVDGLPMKTAALEIGVGPGIGARVTSFHSFEGCERILGCVGLGHPLTVFDEGIPDITVLAGQRDGAGAKKNIAIHTNISPA